MEQKSQYLTFQAFRPHFDALARVGFFKIVLKPLSPFKYTLHYIYRIFIWIIVILYNLQHLIRVIQVRRSTDQMVDTLFILLTLLNTLFKQIAFNVRMPRVDRLINIINGVLFAPSNAYHEKIMKENAMVMSRLLKFYQIGVCTCAGLWTIFPIMSRILGEEVQFTGYIPFDTNPSPAFEFALTYMSVIIAMQAYGNVTLDCTIVAFYAQARTQLQLLRYNLEHLVDSDEIETKITTCEYIGYKDKINITFRDLLQRRLARCVEHYKQIVWYTEEVESIFNEAMAFQIFVMAWVICMTVYKIVGVSLYSGEFISMAVYLACMLAQLFIYCYYGTQVKVESEFVNNSVYNGEWLSLSPEFRRQLLVIMERCLRSLAPRTAYIIPMSLETYISVLRFSYTLFTFLDRK